MPLTLKQQQFLERYVLNAKSKGKGEAKQKRAQAFALKQQMVFDLFAKLDPSCPTYASLESQRNSVEKYGDSLELTKGKKFAEEVIKQLKKQVGLYPLTAPLRPKTPAPLKQVTVVQLPTDVSLDQLRKRVEQANAMVSGASQVGLVTPPQVLRDAVLQANDLIDQKPTTPVKVPAALTGVLECADDLWGFITKWRQCGVQEKQTRKDMPAQPAAVFEKIAADWDTDRAKIRLDFEKLGDASGAAALGTALDDLQQRAKRRRTTQLQTVNGAGKQLGEARLRMNELAQSKLYDLIAARKILQDAETRFANATSDLDLEQVLKAVEQLGESMNKAVKDIPPEKLKALETFKKRRHELSEHILKAQMVRGALVNGSAVKQAVDDVIAMRGQADLKMADAVTAGMAEAAILLLDAALEKKIAATAEKLGKKEKEELESDTKALAPYQKAFDELLKARADVAALPGADKALQALDVLIAKTRVDGSGRPPGGFAQALQAITSANIDKLLKAASVSSGKYLDESLNEFEKQALLLARQALDRYGRFHSEADVSTQREAMAIAALQPGAQGKLTTYTQQLGKQVDEQIKSEKSLQDSVNAVAKQLQHLVDDGMTEDDPSLAVMRRKLDDARGALKEWRLADAKTVLEKLLLEALDAGEAFAETKLAWKKQKEALEALKLRAEKLEKGKFGDVSRLAGGTVFSIGRLLQRVESGELDLATAVEHAEGLVASSSDALDAALKNINLDPETDFAAFHIAAGKLDEAWQKSVQTVRERLGELDLALKEAGVVKGVASMAWPAELEKLDVQWTSVRLHGPTMAGKQSPAEALTEVHARLTGALELLQKGLPDAGEPLSEGFKQEVQKGKDNEVKAKRRTDFDRASQLLMQLRAAGAVPPTNAESDLGTYDAQADDTQAEKWAALVLQLGKQLVEHNKQLQQRRVPNQQKIGLLKSQVEKKFLNLHSVEFRGFFDDLEKQLDDALNMLAVEPPDPLLMAAAEQQIAAITRTLGDAKGKGDEGTITFDRVLEVVGELNKILGEGNQVLTRMPDTHKRLKGLLDQASELAKRSAPDKAVEALEKLRGPILDAYDRARVLQLSHEGFKARRKEVETRFTQLQKHTGTTFGDRAKSYMDRFKARVNDAHALAREEEQIDAALKQLDALDKELIDMLAKPQDAAREDVLALDVQAENEQRELRDMARTFNATLAHWEDTLLPEVGKAVRDEDKDEFKGLKAAVKNVGKTVEPYLAVISKLPHRRAKANVAPDMQAMRAAFTRAYLDLNLLMRRATRLRDGSGSTNVELVTDLNKLEEEWVKRCKEAERALVSLGNSLQGLPKKAVTGDTNKENENYLPDGAVKTLEEAVNQLVPTLTAMSTHFTTGAFTEPLDDLRSKTTTMARRKRAREQALRTVRRLGADVADNPLFQKIFEGTSAGKLELDIRPQIAFVRSALKKIELAALVGI